MYHIFLNQSPVDGHLGCFYVLATINSTAVNTGVHVSFSSFLDICLGVALLDHMATVVLGFFMGPPYCFP